MNVPTLPQKPVSAVSGYASFALVGFALFIALTVVVHLLRPELDPLQRMLSDYAIGSSYGFLFSFSLLCLGAGSFALWKGLGAHLGKSRWSQVGLVLLLLWAIGTVIAGIFPTDPGGIPVSVNGIIHGLGASLAFFSFVFAALFLSLHFRREAGWYAASLPALMISILAFLLLGFFGLPDALRGGGEKVFVGAVVLWLSFVAWRLQQSTEI